MTDLAINFLKIFLSWHWITLRLKNTLTFISKVWKLRHTSTLQRYMESIVKERVMTEKFADLLYFSPVLAQLFGLVFWILKTFDFSNLWSKWCVKGKYDQILDFRYTAICTRKNFLWQVMLWLKSQNISCDQGLV